MFFSPNTQDTYSNRTSLRGNTACQETSPTAGPLRFAQPKANLAGGREDPFNKHKDNRSDGSCLQSQLSENGGLWQVCGHIVSFKPA